jgi:hypothetical protein
LITRCLLAVAIKDVFSLIYHCKAITNVPFAHRICMELAVFLMGMIQPLPFITAAIIVMMITSKILRF